MLTCDRARRARRLGALAFVLPAVLAAQDPTPGADLPTDGSGMLRLRIHGFIIAPAFGSSPAFGIGGGAVLGYQFSHDSVTPAATVGLAGVYSSNGSSVYGIGARAHFQRDHWRVAGGGAQYLLRYDFFGVGTDAGDADTSVRVRQRGNAEVVEATGRIVRGFYFGPRLRHSDFTTRLDRGDSIATIVNLLRVDSTYSTSLAGVVGRYDSRDNTNNPMRGSWVEAWAMFPVGWFGTDRSFQSYFAAVNQYFGLGHDRILALRLSGCGRSEDAPVWELCQFGTGPDLRGYLTGRFRDRNMLAGQGEIRAPVWRRFGAVAFAGVGEVVPSFNNLNWDDLLPGAGIGVRYLVSASSKLHVGVDVAWGKKEFGYYLRIGEAY